MVEHRKELGMKCVVLAGAMAAVLVLGLGSAICAAPADTSTEETRAAELSFFDPFLLTRVVLAPTSVSARGVLAAATVRGSSGTVRSSFNGNGNGHGPPPFIPGRPSLRSPCSPPFGWAFGRVDAN